MEDFLKRLRAHIIAFVAVVLLIASAPLISIALTIMPVVDPRYGEWAIGWFLVVCPFCCGIWYMFIATMTRSARAKLEGVTVRNGFFWAGGRLFGGWLLSQAIVCGFVLSFSAVFGAADGSRAMATERIRIALPVFLFAVWAPVLVNLVRHFRRHRTTVAPPEPVKSSNSQSSALPKEAEHRTETEWKRMGKGFAEFAGDGGNWARFLPPESEIKEPKPALVFDMLAITHSLDITGLGDSESLLWDIVRTVISKMPPVNDGPWNFYEQVVGKVVKRGKVWMPLSLVAMAQYDAESGTSKAGILAQLFVAFAESIAAQVLVYDDVELKRSIRRGDFDSDTDHNLVRSNRIEHYEGFTSLFAKRKSQYLAAYRTAFEPFLTNRRDRRPAMSDEDSMQELEMLKTVEEDCRLLGIDEYYTPDELSAARRAKAAQWHPDKLENMAPELREYASQQLARFNGAYERLEKRVHRNAEHKSLLAEAQDAVAIVESLNREWDQMLGVVSSGSLEASEKVSKIDKIIERHDDGIRRMRACLARAQKEAPTMDVTILQQTISECIALSRSLKKSMAEISPAIERGQFEEALER